MTDSPVAIESGGAVFFCKFYRFIAEKPGNVYNKTVFNMEQSNEE